MSVAGARRTRPSITIPSDLVGDSGSDEGKEIDHLLGRVLDVSSITASDLTIEGMLGRGACSYVQQARHNRTGQLYAVKVFNVFDRDRAKQLISELSTLLQVNCPSLVRFYSVFKSDDRVHLVLEHMQRGSLHNLIYNSHGGPIPEEVIAAITYQILWGLGYLHYEHKLHRDIKPSNILANSYGEVKLTDFGISRELEEDELASTMVGTFRYMSPERLRGDMYGAAADIWSLGLVLLELATRRVPFRHCMNQIELNQLLEEASIDSIIPCDTGFSETFFELVRNCLHYAPKNRLPVRVLFDSPFFTNHEISDLDKAVLVVCEWLQRNPERSGMDAQYTDDADETAAQRMYSTWKSTDSEVSYTDDCKEVPEEKDEDYFGLRPSGTAVVDSDATPTRNALAVGTGPRVSTLSGVRQHLFKARGRRSGRDGSEERRSFSSSSSSSSSTKDVQEVGLVRLRPLPSPRHPSTREEQQGMAGESEQECW
ncbi:unnamed protein product [Chrysoparadoxa australica]